jgi:hypothetical protein
MSRNSEYRASKSRMREFRTSGSVGDRGDKSPRSTRPTLSLRVCTFELLVRGYPRVKTETVQVRLPP